MVVKGIDVSNHQGHIDWDAVANAGYTFAWLKASQGINFRDRWFPRNWEECKRVGIQRGAYHFPEPYNNSDARTETDFFYKIVVEENGLEPGDMLCLDAEVTGPEYYGDYGNWALYWLQIMESYVHFKPVIYTAQNYITQLNLKNPELASFPLWNASWIVNHAAVDLNRLPNTPAPWSMTSFWQYTDKGRVPGVATLCDLNLFNGPLYRLPLIGMPSPSEPEKPPTPNIDVAAITKELLDIEVMKTSIVTESEAITEAVDRIKDLLRGSDPPT